MSREYIRLPKKSIFPDSSIKKRELNDDFWINLVHYHLIKFYKEYNIKELQGYIESENKKNRSSVEDLITGYIKSWFEQFNKQIFRQGIVINTEPKVRYNQPGFYDIKFQHSDWVNHKTKKLKYYPFECKNLKDNEVSVKEYVYNPYKKDGGVYRYFNGKYAQEQNFGGMLGYVLKGTSKEIKKRILTKLNEPFDISPNGNLIKDGIVLNSFEDNEFIFSSTHFRNRKNFTLHHFIFNIN